MSVSAAAAMYATGRPAGESAAGAIKTFHAHPTGRARAAVPVVSAPVGNDHPNRHPSRRTNPVRYIRKSACSIRNRRRYTDNSWYSRRTDSTDTRRRQYPHPRQPHELRWENGRFHEPERWFRTSVSANSTGNASHRTMIRSSKKGTEIQTPAGKRFCKRMAKTNYVIFLPFEIPICEA